jgi:hypothetical protein
VPRDHWSCRETAELSARYGSLKKLPKGEMVKRKALAGVFLDLMEKVREKCDQEGQDAVSREDLDRLAVLYEALKQELPEFEGYLSLRESIEKMLVKSEVPPFEYKLGVAGFLRGEGAGNFHLPDSTYAPGHAEGRILYRLKPYAYWHPAEWLDIHLEGQGYGFSGGGQEYARVSLYQGFVEAKLPGREWLALKGGRQEFSYGSTFMLGTDSFYDGLSFDAARLRLKPIEPLVVDILAGAYARPFAGGVEGDLAGGYATYTFTEGNAVEAYFLRDTGSTDHHAGEHLYIWGLRGTGRLGPVTLEFEPVYESGRVFSRTVGTDAGISAYGGHLDMNSDTTLAGLHNHFFLSYAFGSGSKSAANGISVKNEFRNPNNDTALMGDMGVIGDMSGVTVGGHHASGLQIYTLGWGIDITKELNFSATARHFLANSVAEGFSRHLGLESDFTLTYAVSDNLSFIAGYDRFFTGAFFRDATGSGKDINYGYFMVQFDLSRSKPKARLAKG